MIKYQPTYIDESLDPIIHQILPDIEQSLKQQLLPELQEQAEKLYQKELKKIELQAEEEYSIALHDLESEGNKLLGEQTHQLKKDVERLKKEKVNKQESHFKYLQNKYISQNFQQEILNHKKITQIQIELEQEILSINKEKIEGAKQRKIREMLIKIQNKEQKYKKEKDKSIKNQIYSSHSINELKSDIDVMKINIASMKSQYNVKINKINHQIKNIKTKNKTLQPKQNVSSLRKQLEELQNKRDEINDQLLQNKNYGHHTENNKDSTFSHLDSSQEYEQRQTGAYIKQTDPRTKTNIVVQVEDKSDDQSSYSDDIDVDGVVNPPAYHPSADVSEEQLESYGSNEPILKLNIANLLRKNWDDPLHQYLTNNNKQNITEKNNTHSQNNSKRNYYFGNQNDGKMGNASSFQQIYYQHLEKLNQTTKKRKLSNQAKKAIIKNLAQMHSKNKNTTISI